MMHSRNRRSDTCSAPLGVTHALSFPAKIDVANGGLNVSSQFDLNRHDWGISYGKGNVNDLVKMTLDVKAK